MASNDTKLGLGLATGMFYHAPKGTALPEYPAAELNAAWTLVGDVEKEGITLTTDKSTETLYNWAMVAKRIIMTGHTESIKCPIMDTTAEVLKTTLGESNVTVIAATQDHGALVKANLSSGELPDEEAFLWLMKDGDDMIAIGCTDGQIMSMDDVNFQPESSIKWVPTITALGDGFQVIMDDGQKVSD